MIREIPVRATAQEDIGAIFTGSYSKLDLFQSCHYKYKLKYLDKNFDDSKAIQLNLGSICHKVMELKAQRLLDKQNVDYVYLSKILSEGYNESDSEKIWGVEKIKNWYFEDWYLKDNKSGMTYDQKIHLFCTEVLPVEMEDDEWTVIGCEVPFDFVYKEKIRLHGFIDRIDRNQNNEIRVVDYKTSKAAYAETKLATPLQMFIYGLACYQMYQQFPAEYLYSFILINERQTACTKGYVDRGLKKLDKILETIESCEATGVYSPSPSPLCFYCNYCRNNPKAEASLKCLCDYYSLWTPDNKVFSVNKPFNALTLTQPVRKLIF